MHSQPEPSRDALRDAPISGGLLCSIFDKIASISECWSKISSWVFTCCCETHDRVTSTSWCCGFFHPTARARPADAEACQPGRTPLTGRTERTRLLGLFCQTTHFSERSKSMVNEVSARLGRREDNSCFQQSGHLGAARALQAGCPCPVTGAPRND